MRRVKIILFVLIVFASCKRTSDNPEILKFYGDAREDIGYSVAEGDEGYYICGQATEITRSSGNIISGTSRKPCIIKTDFEGNTIWEKHFGGKLQGLASKVIVLEDGSVVAAGQVTDTVTSKTDILVVRLNSAGTGEKEKILEIEGNQTSTDILKTDEGFLLLGTTDAERGPVTANSGNKAGKKDILLVRLTDDLSMIGNPVPKGYPNDDFGTAVKHDAGGGYIIVGTTDFENILEGKTNKNIILIRFNPYVSASEPVLLGSSDYEYAADIEVLNDGYMIVGTLGDEGVHQSIYIVRTSFNITDPPIFTNKIDHTDSWVINSMSRYKTNSFVLAGRAGTASQADMLIFTIGPDGVPDTRNIKITGSDGIQAAYDVLFDKSGYVVAIGKNSYGTNSMISLLKFRF